MKNNFLKILIVSILWCIFFLYVAGGCKNNINNREPVEMAKTIVPKGGHRTLSDSEFSDSVTEGLSREVATPKAEISPNDILLQVINANLDLDPNEEQILVLKERENPDAMIRISVVDFDTVRNIYKMTWQGMTNANNLRTFNVSLGDIVGDHNLEIICYGMNNNGESTLNVFRKTHAPNGIGLFYTSISEIIAGGAIEIQEQERSQAYKLGQKNDISFPIVTYSHDLESDNIMDLIKSTYYWKYQSNSYVKVKEEKIPGKKIEEKQLEDLFFSKDENAFEEFLDSPWYRVTNNNANPSDVKAISDIFLFEPQNRQISLYSGDIQEVYNWKSSHRTRIANSLYIVCQNDFVPFIGKQISIYVLSLDTIQITISDTDFMKDTNQWDGTYNRLTRVLQKSLKPELKPAESFTASELSGKYSSDTGDEIFFDFPNFIFIEGNIELKGGYSVYSIGDQILELKVLKKNGLLEEKRRYKLNYKKVRTENKIIHTCTLLRGNVGIYGFEPTSDKAITFEQIETVDDQQ
ncbi:MAG: pallilysin-related adhesin [Spirochaetota bacterium]